MFVYSFVGLSSVDYQRNSLCTIVTQNRNGRHKVQQHGERVRGWYRGWSQKAHLREATRRNENPRMVTQRDNHDKKKNGELYTPEDTEP